MIAFSWNGLPQYAARLIRAAKESLHEEVVAVGSAPSVPVEGMERALGAKIHWVDSASKVRWSQLGLSAPRIYFQSGWAYPAFNSLGDEARDAGGKVVLLTDNDYRGNLRQLAGALAFRLSKSRKFDAWFCPGKSGHRLARFYGMPSERIWTGLYGADPAIFSQGAALSARPKVVLFVGQYIERKNCVGLAEAFGEVCPPSCGWELHMYGSGPLSGRIPRRDNIRVMPFVQPEQLGDLYRGARVFALPSHSEAWGLVVHEAAMTGCALLLSDTIGAAADFTGKSNVWSFRHDSHADLCASLRAIISLPDAQLDAAGAESAMLSSSHGPARFAAAVRDIISKLS